MSEVLRPLNEFSPSVGAIKTQAALCVAICRLLAKYLQLKEVINLRNPTRSTDVRSSAVVRQLKLIMQIVCVLN